MSDPSQGRLDLHSFKDAIESVERVSREIAEKWVTAEGVSLAAGIGRVLKDPVSATSDYPSFDNSAVDGYAVSTVEDGRRGARLNVVGTSYAGDAPPPQMAAGTALRIMTGAAVPSQAFGVVMQEDVVAEDGFVEIHAEVAAGDHIRLRGEDFRENDPLLPAGTLLGPGHVATLAMQGCVSLDVLASPTCAVLTTGNELVPTTELPPAGKLRDSNGVMLETQARRAGCSRIDASHIGDDPDGLRDSLSDAVSEHDIVVMSGGVSVGDHDYVPSIVATLGRTVFHGVSMKPGKPVLFGVVDETPVFGLPGNPASSFVGFELFVRRCIRLSFFAGTGVAQSVPVRLKGRHATGKRDEFIRCALDSSGKHLVAESRREQRSFGLLSLADADCLVRLPGGAKHEDGEVREAWLLA